MHFDNIPLHPLTRWRLQQTPPLSANEVAQKVGVHPTYVSMLERGARDRLGGDANLRLSRLTGIQLEVLQAWHWTAKGRSAARRVLKDAAHQFRARAAAKRRKPEAS